MNWPKAKRSLTGEWNRLWSAFWSTGDFVGRNTTLLSMATHTIGCTSFFERHFVHPQTIIGRIRVSNSWVKQLLVQIFGPLLTIQMLQISMGKKNTHIDIWLIQPTPGSIALKQYSTLIKPNCSRRKLMAGLSGTAKRDSSISKI